MMITNKFGSIAIAQILMNQYIIIRSIQYILFINLSINSQSSPACSQSITRYQQCLSVSYENHSDWNQINQEDSSVQGYNSSHDHQQSQIHTPIINKVISDPETLIKLKHQNSINDTIKTNLQKIYLLSTEQVWLFVPKPLKSNNLEENYYTLKRLKNKKIIQNSKGWNILIFTKQQSKRLVQFGFQHNNFNFKFYVSYKNYDDPITAPQINRKGSATLNNRNEDLKYDSPRNQSKARQKKQGTKKKIKFIQKNDGKKLLDQNNIVVNESGKGNEKDFKDDEIFQSQNLQRHQFMYKTPALQTINQGETGRDINGLMPMNSECEEISFSQNQNFRCQVNQVQLENQQLYHSQPNEENLQQSSNEKTKQIIDETLSQGYGSEESLQRMKKALKNKSKKLNKKKRNPQTQTNYVDENNPFCLLGN